MEMPAIENNKKTEGKLLVNKENLLFKSNEEVTEAFSRSMDDLSDYTLEQIRNEEIDLYKKTVKSTLGFDPEINAKNDPFFKVAGVSIEKVSIEKHDVLAKTMPDKTVVSATTSLISKEYFKELKDLRKEKSINGVMLAGTKQLEDGRKVSLGFFDPIMVNKKRNWELLFGFSHFRDKFHPTMSGFNQGTIVLEEEPLAQIRQNSESKNIATKLQEMATWFNHDLISHTAFLPGGANSADSVILAAGGNESLTRDFNNTPIQDASVSSSVFAGELWSLNFHQSVFEEFVSERPAIMRYIRSHMNSYLHSVEKATAGISDRELAEDTKEYLMKAYAFGFFRLISPERFATDPLFKEIHDAYPDLADLGTQEDKVREFAFGEKGMLQKDSIDSKFTPHAELFKTFTGSFEQAKLFDEMRGKLTESLDPLGTQLTSSERREYTELLNKVDPNLVWTILCDNIDNIDELPAAVIKYHLSSAIECLLEEGTTRDTFIEKLEEKLLSPSN